MEDNSSDGWISSLPPIAIDNTGKLKSFSSFMDELEEYHQIFDDPTIVSTYIKFRIQTQRDFHNEIKNMCKNISLMTVKFFSDTAKKLHHKYGNGCFFIFTNNQCTRINGLFEQYKLLDQQLVISERMNIIIIWLPLRAVHFFLMDYADIKLVDNSHYDQYISELGFYVFIMHTPYESDPRYGHSDIIMSNRYVIAPSKHLDNAFKEYFHRHFLTHSKKASVFSVHKFKKLMGKDLVRKIINYECRAILLQKIKDAYCCDESINPSEDIFIALHPITEMTVNKQLLSEYVFTAFMNTFHDTHKKDKFCICKTTEHGMFMRIMRINKETFHQFVHEYLDDFSMINMQYMFMCWIKCKLAITSRNFLITTMHEYVGKWAQMITYRFFKQNRWCLFEQKLLRKVKCRYCGRKRSKNNEKLKLCRVCKTTFYCNRKCQKHDWKIHRQYCCSVWSFYALRA